MDLPPRQFVSVRNIWGWAHSDLGHLWLQRCSSIGDIALAEKSVSGPRGPGNLPRDTKGGKQSHYLTLVKDRNYL
jgi:hypothetical protein